ncbi:unnamed protein product [Notodromas monacha]|uniref:Trehalase n=1 Tax=Notodromas monacha TaxID=399045 RepID=A0A7R9BF70_9CRUS|nr:unnamed protein product [Notodromas monacha]CAG0914191.1 unnamed protein product [Notodromas monacha]
MPSVLITVLVIVAQIVLCFVPGSIAEPAEEVVRPTSTSTMPETRRHDVTSGNEELLPVRKPEPVIKDKSHVSEAQVHKNMTEDFAWLDQLKNSSKGSIFKPTSGFSLVCHGQVYCDEIVLMAVHNEVFFNDSKSFVDLKLRFHPLVVLEALENALQSTEQNVTEAVHQWLEVNFDEAETAFEDFEFSDWNDQDSYWTFLGLTHSGLLSTVRGMLENFVAMVKEYGFIPNGGRVYYENRSQPPMFIPMIKNYLDQVATSNSTQDSDTFERVTPLDLDFLQEYIDIIEQEMVFWLTERSVTFQHNGESMMLFHYATNTTGPRPESFVKDVELVLQVEGDLAKEALYNNLHSACESGWDFSSRWFKPTAGNTVGTLINTKTRDILPVDLNALICYNARVLADFYAMVTDNPESPIVEHYRNISMEIADAMKKVMYDEESGSFYDYDHELNVRRKNFYPSNAWPFWLDCLGRDSNKTEMGLRYLEYLKNETGLSSPLDFPGGVPTSLVETGEQWDFPNAWAPLVHSLIISLDSIDHPSTKQEAYNVAEKWIHTNYVAYKTHNAMFEKYNVTELGAIGAGGEYGVQKGFGWSNGAVLDLLVKYGDRLQTPDLKSASSAFFLNPAAAFFSIITYWVLQYA